MNKSQVFMTGIVDTETVIDNKLFWKTIKPYFSNKAVNNENMTLIENDEIVTNEKEISEIFNKYFIHVVASLEITKKDTDVIGDIFLIN